jgi:hypothetical protein
VGAESHPKGQQIAHRNRSIRWHRVVDGTFDVAHDAPVAQFRQQSLD